MQHLNYCTHISFEEDKDILTRKNFNVSMRLFNSNSMYRNLIVNIANYIKFCAVIKKEGYPVPKGWSGANAGIPFNIIAINNEKQNEFGESLIGEKCVSNIDVVFLNPIITRFYGYKKQVKTNCGSLILQNKILVNRYQYIDLCYYTIDGIYKEWRKIPPFPGYIIQHEIDHTLGILIQNNNE